MIIATNSLIKKIYTCAHVEIIFEKNIKLVYFFRRFQKNINIKLYDKVLKIRLIFSFA